MTQITHLSLPEAPSAVERDFLALGRYQAPARTLSVNSRYLELDGQPWLPVMGEFHYSRYPACEWAAELAKMRAGGVSIVASYVFWNHHEEEEGRYDWSGSRDLRRFVELAAAAGLYVYLRPGPWVHAESRYGGFPDWLVEKIGADLRCNAPAYLAQVEKFYRQIGAQVKGLMWSDGGPVVGVQLENEYDRLGPGCGAEHIAELKRIAIEAGLCVPIYTVTGWPTLDIPLRDVLPVSGAYADGFWQGSSTALPPSGVFVFNTDRAIGEMGNVGGTPADGRIDKAHYPFFLAEAGGGMHVSYHRRPVISTDDVAATTLVQIGSGATLYGYYMYHGGTNPAGPRRYNESMATGYPNDVAVLGYDFHAPLGQYGQVRESWGRLRGLHLFLETFGAELAPMEAVLAEGASLDAAAREPLRVAARGAGASGFVFLNNHVRHHPLPDFNDVRIEVATSEGKVSFPTIDVKSGAYAIWPVNAAIGAAKLVWATVQPLSRWLDAGATHWVGFTIPNVAGQLAFSADTVMGVVCASGVVTREGDLWRVALPGDSERALIRVTDRAGVEHRILVLSRTEADRASRITLGGRERLAISKHALYAEGDSLFIDAPADEDVFADIFPGLGLDGESLAAELIRIPAARAETALAGEVAVTVLCEQPEPPAVRFGEKISWRSEPTPLAPDDEEFANATRIRLTPPASWAKLEGRLLACLDYVGDAARLYADGVLVDDNFSDGEPWYIGLDRFIRDGRWPELELRIIAARPDLDIFLEEGARQRLHEASHPAALNGLAVKRWRSVRLAAGQK